MRLKIILSSMILILIFSLGCVQNGGNNIDKSELRLDNVTITYLGHSSFKIVSTKTIYIDPFVLPHDASKADYILVTHDHYDHCAADNIKSIQGKETRIIGTMSCITKFTGLINSIGPEEYFKYADGVKVDAVEAYNINKSYHPKGFGVGFVITIDGKKIYHAGDTDKIPEMENLKSIDVALLPIGGTVTMDVKEAAEAAKMFNPKIVVPIHYNSGKYGVSSTEANPEQLKELLKGTGIEVKILEPAI